MVAIKISMTYFFFVSHYWRSPSKKDIERAWQVFCKDYLVELKIANLTWENCQNYLRLLRYFEKW